MKNSIVSLIALISFSLNGQVKFNPIVSSNPDNTNYSDFENIRIDFSKYSIIGMGEATHGTSEFHTIRHRFFKYLVQEKGFTTLYLEEDYSACLNLNKAIIGESNLNFDSLLGDIRLIPWACDEFKEILCWMKGENKSRTQEQKLQLVGVDVQSLWFTLYHTDAEATKQHLSFIKDICQTTQPVKSEYDMNREGKTNYTPEIIANIERFIEDTSSMSKYQELHFLLKQLLLIHPYVVNMNNFSWSGEKQRYYRDSCMARNIIEWQENNKNSKGIYYAHNAHVSNTNKTYKNGYQKTMCGWWLKQAFGDNYYAIATDFHSGTFNAYKSHKRSKNKRYQPIYIDKVSRKSLARCIQSSVSPIAFLETKSNTDLKDRYLTSIGIGYNGRNKRGDTYYRYYNNLPLQLFDAVFYFENTEESKYWSYNVGLK
jgi:erythromycin esterase